AFHAGQRLRRRITMQYAPLFRIECLHAYFGGAACRSLALTPTEDSCAMLERYRMLFRQATGGGMVYAPLQSPPDILRQFDECTPFTFRLANTEPALDAYTELNPGETAGPAESVFYFDNSSDQQAEVFGSARQLLHAPKNPFAGAVLPVRPKVFSFTVPPGSAGNELRVVEPLTGEQLWQSPATQGAL